VCIPEGPSFKTFYEHNLEVKKPDKTKLAKPKSLTCSERAMERDLKLQEGRRNKKCLFVFYDHVAVETDDFPVSEMTSPTVCYIRVPFCF
jgi:hypothetical protein